MIVVEPLLIKAGFPSIRIYGGDQESRVNCKLPFSNKEEGGEESGAENDGSESADDAQGAGTHSLSVEGGLIIGGDFCEKQHTVCSARRGWLSASSTRNTLAS